jgi:hypothetical protein
VKKTLSIITLLTVLVSGIVWARDAEFRWRDTAAHLNDGKTPINGDRGIVINRSDNTTTFYYYDNATSEWVEAGVSGSGLLAADNSSTQTGTSTDTYVTPSGLHYLLQHLSALTATAWNVTADGNFTAVRYKTTRGNWAQGACFSEATGDGDSTLCIGPPALGTGLAADSTVTFSKSLAFIGTMTDGKYCTYTSSGAVIACNSEGGGTPGGSSKQVQFNDSSVFAGDGNFTYDKTTKILNGGKLVKTTKVPDYADISTLYNDNGTQEMGFTRKGPHQATAQAYDFVWQEPTGEPTEGQVAAAGPVSNHETRAVWITPLTSVSIPNPTYQEDNGTALVCNGFYDSNSTQIFALPTPSAGCQICLGQKPGGTKAIHANPGSSKYIGKTDNSAYCDSSSSLVSGGAATDSLCIVAYDSTHWRVKSHSGTWTCTP